MALYTQYVAPHGGFLSYEDFCKNFRLTKPEAFHFAYDVADVLADTTPDAVALAWATPREESGTMTFAQMREASDRAANALASHGVGKGSRVLLLLKSHWEYWPILLALHKLGAVAAPASHLLTAQDIAYRLGAANITFVLATAEDGLPQRVDEAAALSGLAPVRMTVRGTQPGWASYEAALAQAKARFARPTGADAPALTDPLLLYFTSGTEGMPKVVLLDQLYPLGHILTAVHWQRVVEGGLHLAVCDTGWSKSAWSQLYGQWLAGSGVFVWDGEDTLDAAAQLRAMAAHRVTTLCAAPAVYRALLGQDFSDYDLSALTHCTLTAEPLHPEIFYQFQERTGLALHEAYGLTETTVLVGNFAFPWAKLQPGSMGRPSPLYDVDIVDGYGKSCPPGVSGEIVVRTHHGVPPGMFRGYGEDAGDAWEDQVYHTRDVAWRDEWGAFWYVGRADDVIRSSGYRIGPFEVESALLDHPAVREAAITGVPDPLRHQIVKATVVLADGFVGDDAMVRELQQHVKQVTAPYKCPRVIHFVDALPKTANGKVQRSALR